MRWQVHGERFIYQSDWVNLSLADVEVPGHHRFDHHVVRMPRPAAGVVIHDVERGVLLIYRHRFITDSWGWEIPAGKVDDGETPEQAARREGIEETGWEPHDPLTHVTTFHPANGTGDHTFHIFYAPGATHWGDPTDATEAERVEWMPVDEVRRLITTDGIRDGLSLCGLSVAFVRGLL